MMSRSVLKQSITLQHEKISDCKRGNQGLLTKLGISPECTSFPHPVTQDPIYIFVDAPYLLKLVRNWLIDIGFKLKGGHVIKKDLPEEFIFKCNTEIRSSYKLSSLHIQCISLKEMQRC